MIKILLSNISGIRKWLESNQRVHQWILVLFLLLVNSLILLPNLGYPNKIVFDETYLIPRAQAYINGIFFQESHPPLGRLVIALGQVIANPEAPSSRYATTDTIQEDWPQNVDISGYRLFPAIFGTINPVLVFGIILILTSNTWMALFTALLLTFDNALITQSRYALSDSTLFLFCLASLLCFVWLQTRDNKPGAKERIIWGLLGVCLSAAFMVKFTGMFVAVVVPFYLYKLWKQGYKRDIAYFLAVSGLSFLIIFVSIWQVHFSLLKTFPENYSDKISERYRKVLEGSYKPNPIDRFWIEIQGSYEFMFGYHENVPELDLSKPDEIGSPWYFWPFGGRAVPYRWDRQFETIQIIYLVGNPITWLLSLLGVIGATATLIANGMFRFMKPGQLYWLGVFTLLYWFYMANVASSLANIV